MVPRWNEECNVVVCPNLSTIHLTLDCRYGADIRTIRAPSSAHIAEFPQFLLRLESNNLSKLILTFDTEEATARPLQVLKELGKIREIMEVAIVGRFPRLKTISFDVGRTQDILGWWTDRIAERFPLLHKKGVIDVMIWMNQKYVLQLSYLRMFCDFMPIFQVR
ncbi:hypothetical protein LXA43DRAFT_481808 [Ganoderma leucocontextum]|nr:hypothetical protein LXA43DRAFT_481808 [Ganoderma leucocontextum]